MTGYFTAPRIAWGVGAIEQLSGLGARRALVAVDPAVSRHEGTRRVVEELAKSDTSVEVVTLGPEPDRVDRIAELAARAARSVPDWLVVIGGGRSIDAAKAARFLAVLPDLRIESVTPMLDLPDPPTVRLAALPTTGGSGAEASATVDLTGPDGAPFEVAHRSLAPEWALIDPGFVASLPPPLVIDGALETAAQAIEAYLSAWANPFSDALAIDAITTVLERLPHAIRWSDDPDARASLQYAATSAGLAASNAQRGIAHSLARALVPATGLAYGRLLGILLGPVLEFDRPAARDRLETLGGAVARTEETYRLPFAGRLARLFESVRVPAHLEAAGVDRDRVDAARDAIVANALRSPAVLANPRVPSAGELAALLERTIRGPAPSSGAARPPL